MTTKDKPRKQKFLSLPYEQQEAERIEQARAFFEKEMGVPVNITDAVRLLLARVHQIINGKLEIKK